MLRLIGNWNRPSIVFAGAIITTTTTAVVATGSTSSSITNSNATKVEVTPFTAINNVLRTINNTSNIISHWKNDAIVLATSAPATTSETFDVIIPTLQSIQRIVRLMGTCIVMTIDYKMIPFYLQLDATRYKKSSRRERNDIVDAKLNSETIQQLDIDEQRIYWENEVQYRQKVFDDAQEIYSSTTAEQRVMSIEERVHVKQNEKQRMIHSAKELAMAQEQLSKIQKSKSTHQGDNGSNMASMATTTSNSLMSQLHARNAKRLLSLCQRNRGVYIKIGQHLANLDYVIPSEYINTLKVLFDTNPITSYDDVCKVIKEDFHESLPTDLFDTFDPNPIASASLAQVHIAYKDGKKYAVKVQHRGLRETSRGDIISLEYAVRLAEYLFPNDFTLGWLADEMAPNLPKELNFINEGQNSERAACFLQQSAPNLSCIIPKVHWDKTSSRVLTMDYEEGVKVTDTSSIEQMGISKKNIATLLSSIFASQVFLSGHVHCDPHEGNVYVRKDNKTGKPIIILFDHGLYKALDTEFRIHYASLWKNLMIADIHGIMKSCYELGIQENESCRLFAGIITARPFDEMIEKHKSNQKSTFRKMYDNIFKKQDSNNNNVLDSKSDETIIRGYAQRFLPNIIALLNVLPRQVLMLLKMNDCLRHIDYTLGIPSANTIMISGQYASYALYLHQMDQVQSWREKLSVWWLYVQVIIRMRINEMVVYCIQAI